MTLNELIAKAGIKTLSRTGNGDILVTGISCDSRSVAAGDLFVAIPGTKVPGDVFIPAALSQGAVAVVSECAPDGASGDQSAPWVQVENARRALGLLGRSLWQVDTGAMRLVGITGTNGKTTIAHLYKMLFDRFFGAEKTWMFGTIDYELGTERKDAVHTTPESLDIFRLISAAPARPQAIVMEVSSHALALDRVSGLTFDLGVFSNLTHDHLDFHGTMENYYRAKKRLFTEFMKRDGCAVVNIDDPWGRRLVREIGQKQAITFGKSPDADVRIVNADCSWKRTMIELDSRGTRLRFESPLRGTFNVYNMTALYAGAHALAIDDTTIEKTFMATGTVTGRMDPVPLDAPFTVVVDYAHTPDALVNILQAVRFLTKGRIICVFGCGGDRDRTKRPLMGKAVADGADEAIVTSDNPRSEKPAAIVDEILRGMPLDFPHQVILDRRSAIQKALEKARSGDCVVIAGKGHESYQEINGVRHPFTDKEIAVALWNAGGSDA